MKISEGIYLYYAYSFVPNYTEDQIANFVEKFPQVYLMT